MTQTTFDSVVDALDHTPDGSDILFAAPDAAEADRLAAKEGGHACTGAQ
jgi:hypothetical protein